jgi:hypothetical protein
MKKIRLAFILAIGCVVTTSVLAQSYDLYTGHEASLDLMGFYASRDKGGGNSSAAGTGLGFNYFITQYLGVGADTYADAFTWPYLLNANAIFRYPIPRTSIAPYAFAGFGREWWHAPQWMGDFGAGAEYRLSQIGRWEHPIGFFADVRGVFPGETRDYAVVRFGFRLVFK